MCSLFNDESGVHTSCAETKSPRHRRAGALSRNWLRVGGLAVAASLWSVVAHAQDPEPVPPPPASLAAQAPAPVAEPPVVAEPVLVPPPAEPAPELAPPAVQPSGPLTGGGDLEEVKKEATVEAPPEEAPAPFYFSDTELQVLFMFGPQRLNDRASSGAPILTFNHFSTNSWGSNFFFLDVESQPASPNWHFLDEQFGLYFEYAPTLSLTKLGLLSLPQDGLLADVQVTGQLNLGYAPGGFPVNRVWLSGLVVDWNIGFATFETQFLVRKERTYDTSWQLTIVWFQPFSIGGLSGEFRGFFDMWRGTENEDEPGTEDKLVVLTQPQVIFKVGPVYLGAEFDIRHDFPRKDFFEEDESTWDIRLGPMLVFNF